MKNCILRFRKEDLFIKVDDIIESLDNVKENLEGQIEEVAYLLEHKILEENLQKKESHQRGYMTNSIECGFYT